MKLRTVFSATVAVLLGTLVIQLAVRIQEKPEGRLIAQWVDRPQSLAELRRLANQIVTGRVVSIDRAEDLVVSAPGEPDNEMRVPVEAVTIVIERSHKGLELRARIGPAPRAQDTVIVFHTGLSAGTSVVGRAAPPQREAPTRPAGAIPRPSRLPTADPEETRTVILHEDPIYQMGERYVLFLSDGPALSVRGATVATKRVVAPAGRYRVGSGDRLVPVTRRGFAGQLRDVQLQQFQAQLGPQLRRRP